MNKYEPKPHRLKWGSVPVPWTVSWTGENAYRLGPAEQRGCLQVVQKHNPGIGKPVFGNPHVNRQYRCVSNDLCDLCGGSLKAKTKVSLSHARPIAHAANNGDILQVEPLLHKACAIISLKHCPSLKKDIRSGEVRIRQVTRHRHQVALVKPESTAELFGVTAPGNSQIIGHAKVHLLRWNDRDLDWLEN